MSHIREFSLSHWKWWNTESHLVINFRLQIFASGEVITILFALSTSFGPMLFHYIICNFGTHLTQSFKRIGNEFYAVSWYKLPYRKIGHWILQLRKSRLDFEDLATIPIASIWRYNGSYLDWSSTTFIWELIFYRLHEPHSRISRCCASFFSLVIILEINSAEFSQTQLNICSFTWFKVSQDSK